MANTFVEYTGDGSTTNYSFTFEYIKEAEVKVTLDGTATTAFTFANATTLSFTTAPANNVKIRIYRETDVSSLKATFFAGSAIKAEDLNDNFTQNNFAVEELRESTWDYDTETIKSNETWVSSDDQIATTAAMDARFQDEATETITSSETWPNDDDTIATTAAIDDRIDTAITNDIAGSDGVSITDDGDGTITVGLSDNSVDLDKIKNDDIIASTETWSNGDSKVATTQAIDNRIDAAINNDVLVDNTGLTKTSAGGQVTLGIGAGSVDFDRIKDDDIITYAEQNSGSPSPADTNIFTASASARRFDTLVQNATPTGSDWEVGKTWLQDDSNKTLSVWNGTSWSTVSQGGGFRTQDKVIYVDKSGGSDTSNGHRISAPKATIKSAIADINADIAISTESSDGFNGGSGYTDGSYTNVALTGGTTGSGLTANITVSSGIVTAVENVSSTTLQEYQIGDVLSAADADLGGGGGSGLAIPIIGDGDGMTVIVSAGVYQEAAPIQIKRRNVSIIGMALRSTIVHPTVATQGDQSTGNHALFELNSGSFLQNLTLTGMQAGTGTGNSVDSVLPDRQGWNFAFYNNAYISKSPYIQNCTNFSDSEVDNSDLRAHRPRGGSAGDVDSAPTGGGMLVDGSVPKSDSPLRSMVADSYTHVGLNGPGILVTNNGYCQATSSYAFFNKYHIKTLNGGQANLAASTTDFGDQGLVADGKSTAAIFTSNVDGAAADGDITFNINEPTAGTGWFGDTQRPASNMLVEVNSVIYPVLSATANTDSEGGAGWTVTISRPDSNDRSTNLGLNGALTDDLAVNFYLRSMIASSGHTMEYVGSGTDYRALPENGGVPDETKQITESNNGKVWTAITDHNGKFKIGGNQTDDPIFEVDQQLGFVTIPEGSIAFNLLSDTTPQLGGDLDVNGNSIVSASNGNIHIEPDGTGVVQIGDTSGGVSSSYIEITDNQIRQVGYGELALDASASGINVKAQLTSNLNTNIDIYPRGTGNVDFDPFGFGGTRLVGVDDPVNAQDVATKAYVDSAAIGELIEDTTPQLGGNLDVNGNDIVSVSNGDIRILPNGSGTLQLDGITINGQEIDTVGQTDLILNADQYIRVRKTIISDTNNDIVLAPQGISNVNVASNRITNVTDPTGAQDAATKNYVDTNFVDQTSATGSAQLPVGTQLQRDGSPVAGMIRFNSDTNQFEGYNGTAWTSVGGGATGGAGEQWAVEHENTIDNDHTISTGKNCISAGPMTISSGATVTVPSGSTWVIA